MPHLWSHGPVSTDHLLKKENELPWTLNLLCNLLKELPITRLQTQSCISFASQKSWPHLGLLGERGNRIFVEAVTKKKIIKISVAVMELSVEALHRIKNGAFQTAVHVCDRKHFSYRAHKLYSLKYTVRGINCRKIEPRGSTSLTRVKISKWRSGAKGTKTTSGKPAWALSKTNHKQRETPSSFCFLIFLTLL